MPNPDRQFVTPARAKRRVGEDLGGRLRKSQQLQRYMAAIIHNTDAFVQICSQIRAAATELAQNPRVYPPHNIVTARSTLLSTFPAK